MIKKYKKSKFEINNSKQGSEKGKIDINDIIKKRKKKVDDQS